MSVTTKTAVLTFLLLLSFTGNAASQGFIDQTLLSGLGVVPPSTHHGGTGMCAGDFDGDGDQDLVIAADPGRPWWYFRNDGGMNFTERGAASGLGPPSFVVTRGIAAGDVDNDGDLDLFICRMGGPSQLFINDGLGTFTDEGNARGLTGAWHSFSVSFADFDRDGWLDISVSNHPDLNNSPAEPNLLYRNLGGGMFVEVAAQAGVADMGASYSATFVDYDEDDWPDIYVANQSSSAPWVPGSTMYRNNGDGTFTDVGAATNTQPGGLCIAVDHADVFNDGGVDLFVTAGPPHLFLQWNPGSASYNHSQATYGLTQSSQGQFGAPARGWACHLIDYDCDGWQDLYIAQLALPNLFFRNPGAPASAAVPWTETAATLGLDYSASDQYTSLRADFDNDGKPDLLDRYRAGGFTGLGLKRNDVSGGNHLAIKCVGTTSNRSGIGAQITVSAGSLVQRQAVRSGTGFLSGSDLRCFFGLGTATSADVHIRWPSGQEQTLLGLGVNQQVVAVEPELSFSGTPLPGATVALDLSVPGDGGMPFMMAIAASNAPPIPLPDGRVIPIAYDTVAQLTLTPGNPVLPSGSGILDPAGAAIRPVFIPALPFLSGFTAHVTAVTTMPGGAVKTVFPNSLAITIQ